jgi:stearoyl-CoA desaturase (delta-9 desaturase)
MNFDGILGFGLWGYVLSALLLTHVTIACVTIFLHRHQAHRALSLHPAVSHFFRLWLWLTTGMVTREWVAVHRKHHAVCETEADPHSPQIWGILRVLFGGVGLYRTAALNEETIKVYGRGTPDDWLERNVYGRHRFTGLWIMLLVDLALFGLAGAAIWGVQMLWIPFWAAGVINGVGHYFGYRNFETQDASRNIVPFGILVGGEELHNNHHAYAYSAKLANKWWEIDIGWVYIRILAALRLATVRRRAPQASFAADKASIDIDTLRAVVVNRFHVMKLYGRRVLGPVLRVHCHSHDAALPRDKLGTIKRLMIRDDVALERGDHGDHGARQWLETALQRNQTLQTVSRFMGELKALSGQAGQNDSDRLQALKTWCAEAEASGIRVLRDFARQLQGYTLQAT